MFLLGGVIIRVLQELLATKEWYMLSSIHLLENYFIHTMEHVGDISKMIYWK